MMWRWIVENAKALEALAAVGTALIAVGALLAVKYQVDAAGQLQRAQSARDIYREFLSISIQRPELSSANYCEIGEKKLLHSYESYIEYFLYTAEQVIYAGEEWRPTVVEVLNTHKSYICSRDEWTGYSPDVMRMIYDVKDKHCTPEHVCVR